MSAAASPAVDTTTRDFADFYAATFPGLVAQLYAVTGDRTEAEECAQEAFVRAWPRWEKLSTYDAPRAWVVTVGHRVAVSRWRRTRTALTRSRADRAPEPSPGPDPDTLVLVAALRRLPESQRTALVQHHMGGLAVAEIARRAGVPEGTVKARLSRGRIALAALLTDDDTGGVPTVPDRAPTPEAHHA